MPMDHGVSQGPIDGLIDLGAAVDAVALGGANAVLGHIGLADPPPSPAARPRRRPDPHLSASTAIGPDPNEKVLVNTVTNALRMGADAVSMHVNIGADSEARMLEDLGRVAVQCQHWGMPLLAMMYPRGRKIRTAGDGRPRQARPGVAAESARTSSRPCTRATPTRSAR